MGAYLSGVTPLRRYPRTVLVPQPAAGSDWSYTVPGGVMWRLVTVLGQFATSAVVASRAPFLTVSDGATVYLKVPPQATQAASNTDQYVWWRDAPQYAVGGGVVQPIPELTLMPGYAIAALTTALDVGDQWSGVVLHVIETMIGAGPIDLNTVPEMVVLTMPAGGSGGSIS